MIRIYLAADSSCQAKMRELRNHLKLYDIHVTSRWLDVDLEGDKGKTYTPTELQEWAIKDLDDVLGADLLVSYNPIEKQKQGTGGRHVEFGYAIAKGMPIIYCGEKLENIFHYLPHVKSVIDPRDCSSFYIFAECLGAVINSVFMSTR